MLLNKPIKIKAKNNAIYDIYEHCSFTQFPVHD